MFNAYSLDAGSLREGIDMRLMSKVLKTLPRGTSMDALNGLALIHFPGLQTVADHKCPILDEERADSLIKKFQVFMMRRGDQRKLGMSDGKVHYVGLDSFGKLIMSDTFPLKVRGSQSDLPTGSLERRLAEWFASGDTGISSEAICKKLFDFGDRRDYNKWAGSGNFPHDPSDLGRCIRLMEKVPEARERLSEMRTVSPTWAALVDRWEELEALYREEAPAGRAPKCYLLMQEIIKGCESKCMKTSGMRAR